MNLNTSRRRSLQNKTLGLIITIIAFVGCADSNQSELEARKEIAIQRLESGQVIRDLESQTTPGGRLFQGRAILKNPAGLTSPIYYSKQNQKKAYLSKLDLQLFPRLFSKDDSTQKGLMTSIGVQTQLNSIQSGAEVSVRNLIKSEYCRFANPKPGAPESAYRKALLHLGSCFRKAMAPAHLAASTFQYFKYYQLPKGSPPLSSMTGDEKKAFLDQYGDSLPVDSYLKKKDEPKRKRLRSQFSDEDLVEAIILAGQRRLEYEKGEAIVLDVVEHYRALVERYAKIDRYAGLLALARQRNDLKGQKTFRALVEALEKAQQNLSPEKRWPLPSSDQEYGFIPYLHPYALDALIPDEVSEENPDADIQPLHPLLEDPFAHAQEMLAELEGDDVLLELMVEIYRSARNQEQTTQIDEHLKPHPQAVRVGFIDSGIDFGSYPELGMFLGRPDHKSELQSYDYADDDPNPFLRDIEGAGFGHGSHTVASFLTVLARFSRETLERQKLDLAMWKTFTTRNILAGPFVSMESWSNRAPLVPQIVIDRVENHVQADVISVSMGFLTWEYLKYVKKEDTLLNSSSLWVMAAGNESRNLDKATLQTSCFGDVPEKNKHRDKILCIGALERGMVEPKIARYSNTGSLVDVYAYESYHELCPSGTSCSTPAVSAAATAIKARFPVLSAADIKAIIVEAAEERDLAVDLSPESAMIALISGEEIQTHHTVRVFDPPAMLPEALRIAKAKAKQKRNPKRLAKASR